MDKDEDEDESGLQGGGKSDGRVDYSMTLRLMVPVVVWLLAVLFNLFSFRISSFPAEPVTTGVLQMEEDPVWRSMLFDQQGWYLAERIEGELLIMGAGFSPDRPGVQLGIPASAGKRVTVNRESIPQRPNFDSARVSFLRSHQQNSEGATVRCRKQFDRSSSYCGFSVFWEEPLPRGELVLRATWLPGNEIALIEKSLLKKLRNHNWSERSRLSNRTDG